MKFLARLRLAYDLLRARRTGQWRKLVDACSAEQARLGNLSLLAAIAEANRLDTERETLLAGTRTTHTAERLAAEARQLVQPKTKG